MPKTSFPLPTKKPFHPPSLPPAQHDKSRCRRSCHLTKISRKTGYLGKAERAPARPARARGRQGRAAAAPWRRGRGPGQERAPRPGRRRAGRGRRRGSGAGFRARCEARDPRAGPTRRARAGGEAEGGSGWSSRATHGVRVGCSSDPQGEGRWGPKAEPVKSEPGTALSPGVEGPGAGPGGSHQVQPRALCGAQLRPRGGRDAPDLQRGDQKAARPGSGPGCRAQASSGCRETPGRHRRAPG